MLTQIDRLSLNKKGKNEMKTAEYIRFREKMEELDAATMQPIAR
jgi:hypothetical protein